jgi:hypothetical protein
MGAVDNASGCGVSLELLAKLKVRPPNQTTTKTYATACNPSWVGMFLSFQI